MIGCSAAEWRYFTLMSIFTSLTGMLSLLSLYLYIKIRDKIKKKRSLKKEARVFRQGQSSWAVACVGGWRRADFVFTEPMAQQPSKPKGEEEREGQEVW